MFQHPSLAGQLSFPSRGIEEFRPYITDKVFRAEPDYEEENESGYTIVGGEEIEVLPEEGHDVDEDSDEDED